jgi:hypothetical protein
MNSIKYSFPLATLFLFASVAVSISQITVEERPISTSTNAFYVGNRPPLELSPFYKLPIGSIHPGGWLRHQLEMGRNGMTGHLDEISRWLNFSNSVWANPQGLGKNGWE